MDTQKCNHRGSLLDLASEPQRPRLDRGVLLFVLAHVRGPAAVAAIVAPAGSEMVTKLEVLGSYGRQSRRYR